MIFLRTKEEQGRPMMVKGSYVDGAVDEFSVDPEIRKSDVTVHIL